MSPKIGLQPRNGQTKHENLAKVMLRYLFSTAQAFQLREHDEEMWIGGIGQSRDWPHYPRKSHIHNALGLNCCAKLEEKFFSDDCMSIIEGPEVSTIGKRAWHGVKALITGGLGFIGSTLAIRLSELGADVTVADSLIPEYGGNLQNVSGVVDKIRINYSDIRDPFSLYPLLKNTEVLFSLAGQSSHMDSMTDPHKDLDINCSGQLNLLEACRKVNPAIQVVFASTRQLYGRPLYLPVDEDHPVAPVDVNGINKYAAEMYYLLYHRVYGIRSCCLRLTNTIGPRMRIKDAKQTFLGIWVKKLLQNEPIEVWGGEQLRDFNDVEDVVDALLLATFEPKSFGQVYNLGSKQIISLRDLAALMIDINGAGEFKVMDYPEERKKIDIGDYYSSFSRFSDATGWHPRKSLRETLSRTLSYYRSNLTNYL